MCSCFCKNPAIVVLALWAISLIANIIILSGTPQLIYVVPLQAVCMIGSVAYLTRFTKEKTC